MTGAIDHRVHQTLRVTPAMEAGISDHVWDIAEIVALLGAATMIRREGAWLLGCALVATLHCWLPNEYGLSAAPFFTVAFYVLSGIVRLILHLVRRFSH